MGVDSRRAAKAVDAAATVLPLPSLAHSFLRDTTIHRLPSKWSMSCSVACVKARTTSWVRPTAWSAMSSTYSQIVSVTDGASGME